MADLISGVGPLFGPDFVTVTTNDETGKPFSVQIYPDALNPELRAAGLPTQYYFQPSQVFLARKHDAPDDYDFQMTLFKGLGTEETQLTPADLEGASTEMGGGFCTFSTTFAIPDTVISGVLQKLKARDHAAPSARMANYFNHQNGDPEPLLGIVPITNSAVTCAIPDANTVGGFLKMSAQYSGKGSIEPHGINTFLVSANLYAGGAIASALKAGAAPPFTVVNMLTESFYINGVTVIVTAHADKVYDSFSAAISAGGFLGIDQFSADYAYSACVTSGAITTDITINGAVLDDATKKWVTDNVDAMKKAAMDLVKTEIFDWDPSKTDSKASASRGWWSEVFGGASVSLKSDHQRRSVNYTQTLILNETISVTQVVGGDLNDLVPAVRANLDKYLVVIDIGEYFKKVQVAGYCVIDFSERLEDGSILTVPVKSVQIEVGYPEYAAPTEGGQPNLSMLAQGSHYTLGQPAPKGPVQPAIWLPENAKDFVNISFLRLDKPVPGWPADQVKIRRKVIFDTQDPRVNLSAAATPHDPAVVEIEELTTDHSPVLSIGMVGSVFVRFSIAQQLPPNLTVTITPTIGSDTYPPITVTKQNAKNALWEVYSDKYIDVDKFTYTMSVEVDPPGFGDDPITYSSPEPWTVPLPKGLVKHITSLATLLPSIPADKKAQVNDWCAQAIRASYQQPAAAVQP